MPLSSLNWIWWTSSWVLYSFSSWGCHQYSVQFNISFPPGKPLQWLPNFFFWNLLLDWRIFNSRDSHQSYSLTLNIVQPYCYMLMWNSQEKYKHKKSIKNHIFKVLYKQSRLSATPLQYLHTAPGVSSPSLGNTGRLIFEGLHTERWDLRLVFHRVITN